MIQAFSEMPFPIIQLFQPLKYRHIPLRHSVTGIQQQPVLHRVIPVMWIHAAQHDIYSCLLKRIFDANQIVLKNTLNNPAGLQLVRIRKPLVGKSQPYNAQVRMM